MQIHVPDRGRQRDLHAEQTDLLRDVEAIIRPAS